MTRPLNLPLLPVLLMPLVTNAATWYVDGSVEQSGDGTSWETAFRTVWEGVGAAREADTVIVAPGVYDGSSAAGGPGAGSRFPMVADARRTAAFPIAGKNFILRSVDPLDPRVVATTVLDGDGTRSVISFGGTEDASMVLSGFTIRNGYNPMHGGGINGYGTHATIRNNVIAMNRAVAPKDRKAEGAGLYDCDGIIQGNVIAGNLATWEEWGLMSRAEGGGLSRCDGVIRNNVVKGNSASTYGGGMFACEAILVNNVIVRNWAETGGGLMGCYPTITNCVIWGNDALYGPNLRETADPTYSCIPGGSYEGRRNVDGPPGFVDEAKGDFRLRGDSPCIDAGLNSPDLPQFDIAGMPRIMYGGKSLTVDMGAYEFFYTGVQRGPGPDDATLVWSFVPDKTYSIFYTDDLFNWHLVIANFPSSGNETTSWTDDGSLTGLPPLLAPRRFYRLLEDP